MLKKRKKKLQKTKKELQKTKKNERVITVVVAAAADVVATVLFGKNSESMDYSVSSCDCPNAILVRLIPRTVYGHQCWATKPNTSSRRRSPF